jgi:uncharacterized protein (TIGR02271 family)
MTIMENWKLFNKSSDGNASERLPSNKVPVLEEHIRIGRQFVETGHVTIAKKVLLEDVTLDVPVSHEEVVVERKEINQYVSEVPPASRQEGDTIIISVFKEVVVVEKKILLVEEVHITKRLIESSLPIIDTIRKEEVTVTRTPTQS